MAESPIRLFLRPIREAHGLSQQALADKAGIPSSYISQLESGARLPSLPMLVRVAHALGVQAKDLLDERPCPGCPYWEREAQRMGHCQPGSPVLDAARRYQQALGATLRRRTTWLSALGPSALTAWWCW